MTTSLRTLPPLDGQTPEPGALPPEERTFWLRIREARLIELRAIEDKLGLPHSVPSSRAQGRHPQTRTGVLD